MANLLDSATAALRRSFCGAIAAVDRFAELLYPENLLGDYPVAARRFGTNLFCNREPPQLPDAVGGGQCAVEYRIQANYSSSHPTLPAITGSIDRNFFGKITSVRAEVQSGSYVFVITHGLSGNPNAGISDNVGSIFNGVPNGYQFPVLSSVRITRTDGLPDNCGSIPPPLPVPIPPTGTSDPISFTYTNEFNIDINVDGSVTFSPVVVGVAGALIIPFSLNLNANFNIPLSGTINLTTGDINFNLGGNGQGNEGTDCKDPSKLPPADDEPPGSSPPPVADPPLNPDDPDKPKVKLLRGVVCYVSGDSSRVTQVPQPNSQTLYVPRCGNVRFLIQVGQSVVWSRAIPVQSDRELIRCDWEGGALDVRVDPYAGFDIDIQRVYYSES